MQQAIRRVIVINQRSMYRGRLGWASEDARRDLGDCVTSVRLDDGPELLFELEELETVRVRPNPIYVGECAAARDRQALNKEGETHENV